MKKRTKEMLILSAIGVIIAAIVSATRAQPAFGGEFCLPILLPFAWLWFCQIHDDLQA
jgi:hypothetical protein